MLFRSQYLKINIGTGVSTSFIELITQNYTIVYNKECPSIEKMGNKPSGMLHRLSDTTSQQKFNILPSISLIDGIKTLI